MRVFTTSLITWLYAWCLYYPAKCSTSHDFTQLQNQARVSKTDESQDDIDDNEFENFDDEDEQNETEDYTTDDIKQELDSSEKRLEKSEKELEDVEDDSLKEDLDEEESEVDFAKSKNEIRKGGEDVDDVAKARIRDLMDELVKASIELQEINRALDEL
ncbi:uncharacterized protein BBOV_IV001475 [Babesia bovis T2Bo]|uniref:uncharacterized protein n=1 Tax=Babesia bovis T2Bo TaxID=484906 RepID=UPI001D30AC27|nr:uncharacterized protein BBOV_IV001475 [Babesia bovis T2Bo]KAG6439905.1 hypothetical protein BBOV_IV001475 [Babesia bovis T2Bo]